MSEIQQLIDEYNAAEADQAARLRDLFDLMKTRKGYRRIVFSSGPPWSNCWGLHPTGEESVINAHLSTINQADGID